MFSPLSSDIALRAQQVHVERLFSLGYTFEDDQGNSLTPGEAAQRHADGEPVVTIAPP